MGERLHYLDNLRTFAVMLVLLHHIAITYGAPGSWYHHETGGGMITSLVLTLFVAVNQAFFMGLLFFISGYFTAPSYDRKGAARFLRDKLVRFGIPLLFYAFVLGPALIFFLHVRGKASFLDYYRAEILSLKHIGFGPLWFVEALLIFNVAYIVGKALSPPGGARRATGFPSLRALFLVAFLIGGAAFCLRLAWPTGVNIFELQLGYFASYIALFFFGIAAYRRGWLEDIPARTVRIWTITAVIAILFLPVIIVLGGALTGSIDSFSGGWNLQALSYALWEPFVAFGIILFLLTRFKRCLNRAGSFLRALSQSSYTAYIIHPPVLVGISFLARDWAFPALLKFILAGLIGIAACFSVSYLIIRIPGMKRVL